MSEKEAVQKLQEYHNQRNRLCSEKDFERFVEVNEKIRYYNREVLQEIARLTFNPYWQKNPTIVSRVYHLGDLVWEGCSDRTIKNKEREQERKVFRVRQ